MSKDRRLGKGLAALLGQQVEDPSEKDAGAPGGSDPQATVTPRKAQPPILGTIVGQTSTDANSQPDNNSLVELSIDQIETNPFQPRREFNEPEIAAMAESLKSHDMLQPVLVRKFGDCYQLISGERRLRAAKQAGWKTVPARIREADDRLVAELAIVENLQRKDLNPIEKALSFKRYLDEHQCRQEELAKRLKIDRSTIANLVRLLELPERVVSAVQQGTVSAGHARALLPLGEEKQQIALSAKIQNEGLSVRAIEKMVREMIAKEDGNPLQPKKAKSAESEHVTALEQEIRLALGVKVEIKKTAKGRGKIVLHFTSNDEFERIKNELAGASAGPTAKAA